MTDKHKEGTLSFIIDKDFETYWPALPDEKLVVLEDSILRDGLRENLVVWKEKNVLLDGHQRKRICDKHGIDIGGKVTYLSFPDSVHAKHWVQTAQVGRRGDAPQFLSICHVLEFESIYREEAKGRMAQGGKIGKGVAPCRTLSEKGRMTAFMARDAAASAHSVERVLYIRKHDPERFRELERLARNGQDIAIHLEHSRVRAAVEADEAKVKIDREALQKIQSSNTVDAFSASVMKYKPPVSAQREAVESIVKNDKTANKNFVEDAIIHHLPKRESIRREDRSGIAQMTDTMNDIAGHMKKAIAGVDTLNELRAKFGDDQYHQAFVAAPELRAAFARFNIAAKSFSNGGSK